MERCEGPRNMLDILVTSADICLHQMASDGGIASLLILPGSNMGLDMDVDLGSLHSILAKQEQKAAILPLLLVPVSSCGWQQKTCVALFANGLGNPQQCDLYK